MKITYHISCCNFIDGEINALHTNEFYDQIVDRLQKEDVEHIQVQKAQKIFDKHNTGAELLLIFWAENYAKFLRLFIELVSKYHESLCQDSYYVELDNDIVIIKGVGAGETSISYELNQQGQFFEK